MKNIFYCLSILLLSLHSYAENSNSPRFLIHLLDYLAQDYPAAVQNGKILNDNEYKEQIEFSKMAVDLSDKLEELKANTEIKNEIIKLNQSILQKSDPGLIFKLARNIQANVIQLTKLEISPIQWPHLSSGKQIFAQQCASCHGITGVGDGVAGQNLDPKPTNFHDTNKMKGLSAFQIFNTIRLGIPGTAMSAHTQLSDKEIWDISFYILSLRYQENSPGKPASLQELSLKEKTGDDQILKLAATQSDEHLESLLNNKEDVAKLRLYTSDNDSNHFIHLAKKYLQESFDAYLGNNFDISKNKALLAYLDGVEPIEPRLKANHAHVTIELEKAMATVRASIDAHSPVTELKIQIQKAESILLSAEKLLSEEKITSPWVTFSLASGILLREGFEAVLLIILLITIIQASGATYALRWVHGGWVSALGLGFIGWFFSGHIINISGAGREVLEAIISLIAVAMLLYIGFWLHSKTEINKWKIFIESKIQNALNTKNLLGLAFISFIAVFREVFETILFLRAVWLESGTANKNALTLGVFGALGFVLICSVLFVKYSKRIPIRKLFSISSSMMIVLAVVLAGKGIHSLQEAGKISVTFLPTEFYFDLIGLYSSYETITAQLMTVAISFFLWRLSHSKSEQKCNSSEILLR